MPRIAIDGRELINLGAGKSRYVRELLLAIFNQDKTNTYLIFTKDKINLKLPANAKNIILQKHYGSRYLWQRKFLSENNIDLFFSPTGYHPVLFSTIPSIITVHDLAIFVEPKARPSWKGWLYEYAFIRFALKKSKAIIAVSSNTENDLVNKFKVKPSIITVTYLAAYKDYFINKRLSNLPENYFLFVGTIEPRKNIETLIRAYMRLDFVTRQKYPLLIIGKKGWNYEPVFELLDTIKDNTVRWLNYVDNADLPSYYLHATAFVYPSWYEGFGLPVVEAMNYGTPVITSNTSSLPEVVGSAGILIDPRNEKELSDSMLILIKDKPLRDKFSVLGKKQAASFSWDKTAKATIDLFNKVIMEEKYNAK